MDRFHPYPYKDSYSRILTKSNFDTSHSFLRSVTCKNIFFKATTIIAAKAHCNVNDCSFSEENIQEIKNMGNRKKNKDI